MIALEPKYRSTDEVSQHQLENRQSHPENQRCRVPFQPWQRESAAMLLMMICVLATFSASVTKRLHETS